VSWSPQIDWDTPAGRALRKLIATLPAGREFSITLFGSSPLQLGIENNFRSADVDLFAGDWGEIYEEVKAAVERAGLAKEQGAEPYVQVCVEANFKTSPRWKDRAFRTQVGCVRLTLPHPLDILIAKLHRLEEKDLRAFRLVIERTGHPTEQEMREELQVAVDLFRPNFDEEMVGDIRTNTRVLWQELWGKDINVGQEIIAPAIALRNKGYEDDRARADYTNRLRELAAQ
jgi:hypothetical protein